MADLDNSRWRPPEIPERCPVHASRKDTCANRKGITRINGNKLFPLQGKDAVHNDLATVAPTRGAEGTQSECADAGSLIQGVLH